ncbi:hypothetical protein Ddye_014218 [Dipteronia dyeriana]|uniref:Reverse transcriptase domain-containing protein n=1 Tax=Dipteronia dyeriana TaxID=168575 RepID=A0AAD9X7T7_9ROSI|nr:hypothetical protein Ddye_014218 [Dipteronia dyeriana]
MMRRDYKGFKQSRSGPVISHLLFTDDCLIFSGGTTKECRIIRRLLEVYSIATGRCVNFDRSGMCFSKAVSLEKGKRLVVVVGVRHVRYLGIPSLATRNK